MIIVDTNNSTYSVYPLSNISSIYTYGSNYNVHPMLILGPESFTTIGFRTNGKSFNFEIMKKMPGEATADAHHDPYGRHGFWSIQWTYGTMILRNERMLCIRSVARI